MFNSEDEPFDDPAEDFYDPLEDMFVDFTVESIESVGPNQSSDDLKSKACDHSADKKEIKTIPQSAGASFAGFGANLGAGAVVLVCKECEKIFPLDDTRGSGGRMD